MAQMNNEARSITTRQFRVGGRDELMMVLRELGWTYRKISERFGLTPAGVNAAIRRCKWRKRKALGDCGLGTRAINTLRQAFPELDKLPRKPLTIEMIAGLDYQALRALGEMGPVTLLEVATMLRRRGINVQGLPEKYRQEVERRVGVSPFNRIEKSSGDKQ